MNTMIDFIKKHILHKKTLTIVAAFVALGAFIAAGYILFSMPQEAEASSCRTATANSNSAYAYAEAYMGGSSDYDSDSQSITHTVNFSDYTNSDEYVDKIAFTFNASGGVSNCGGTCSYSASGNALGAETSVSNTVYTSDNSSIQESFTRDIGSNTSSVDFLLDAQTDVESDAGETAQGEAEAKVSGIDLTICEKDTNSAPNAYNDGSDTNRIPVKFESTKEIDVLANDSDPDGDPITVTGATTNSTNSSAGPTSDGSAVSYSAGTLNTGDQDQISYSISDGNGGSDSATAYIKITKEQGTAEVSAPSGTTYTPTWDGTSQATGDTNTQYTYDLKKDAKVFKLPKSSVAAPTGYRVPDTGWVSKTVATDKTGSSNAAEMGLTYESDYNPTASFTFSPTSPTTEDYVEFDGRGSDDSDGTIEMWAWDFGDGTSNNTGSTPVDHTYSSSGDYTATLTVTDDDSNTDSISKTVSVDPPPNDPPTASYSYSPTSPTEGDVVEFDGRNSSDSDGTVETWGWDFGDGTTNNTGSTPVDHTYNSSGDYTATLTVYDDDGATDSVSKTVSVSANSAPTADAVASKNTETSYDLYGDGSSDPDGDTLTYQWQVVTSSGGTATINDPDAMNTYVTFTPDYGSSASYTIGLTVDDGEYSDYNETDSISVPCQSGCDDDTQLK